MRQSLPSICRLLAGFLLVAGPLLTVAAFEPTGNNESADMKSNVKLELVGRLPRQPGGNVGYLALHGKHVLLVNADGLQVVEVSNPALPKVVGSYQSQDALGAVAAAGAYVFVVEDDNLVRVLDVSDPTQPRVVGSSRLPNTVRGLAAAGKHLYVSLSESLRVLDVSDPVQPKEVGVCGNLELAGRVTVAGKYAYVAADFNGMRIIDVSDPAQPKEIGAFEGPGNVTEIAIVDLHAYLADYSGGFYIVDLSHPRKPRQIARYGDFVVGDVAVAGNYALLAAGGLHAIDVSKPARPREAASYAEEDSDTAWSVAAAGEYVYTISDAGLFIFRLAPPAASR